jgi:hypothetical protein
MTIVPSRLHQLSPAVASSFIPLLTFAPTFISVLQLIELCLISICGLALVLAEKETSHFGARVRKGKAPGFDNLYFCKELIAVPSNGSGEGKRRRFSGPRPFGHSFGGFPEHAP